MTIKVSKNGGDFEKIQDAIDAVPEDGSAVIHIGEGVFREKLFCRKRDITFEGEDAQSTIIDFDDCANQIMEDGTGRGTFRSYTAFFGGERVTVRNLTIKNSAGDGRKVGQAVAVYADAAVCLFENVRLMGRQDTLFCAPLPASERQKGGFKGPGEEKPRRLTKQYYKSCMITGDVDFIFGGADAVFEDCEIIVCNREGVDHRNDREVIVTADRQNSGEDSSGKAASTIDKDQIDTSERFVNGYVTAACTDGDSLGFVFKRCRIRGEDGCARNSVFLGRPWREKAKTVFIDCTMDDSIAKERFSGWGGITKEEPLTYYGEYGTRLMEDGSTADLSNKNPWVKDIDESTAEDILRRADEVIDICCGNG